MATLGASPLYYSSEWDVRCDARIRTGDGREIARYPLQETGTYKIIALPPTMFTLLGAGVRGASDYKAVEKKLASLQLLAEKATQREIAVRDAEIRIEEAKGIAEAQRIINATLTSNYLQHEAIQAQLRMADAPNHTTVYIPVGTTGIPLVQPLER